MSATVTLTDEQIAALRAILAQCEVAAPPPPEPPSTDLPDDYWPLLAQIESGGRPICESTRLPPHPACISSSAPHGSARAGNGGRICRKRSAGSSRAKKSSYSGPRASRRRTQHSSRSVACPSTKRRSTPRTSSGLSRQRKSLPPTSAPVLNRWLARMQPRQSVDPEGQDGRAVP
jgi:hypothetical protein